MSFATVDVRREDDRLVLARGALSLSVVAGSTPATILAEVIVGIRPEHAHIWADGRPLVGPIEGAVTFVEMLGREALVGVTVGGDQRFTVFTGADEPVTIGDRLRFGVEPGRLYLFDPTSQRTLSTA